MKKITKRYEIRLGPEERKLIAQLTKQTGLNAPSLLRMGLRKLAEEKSA